MREIDNNSLKKIELDLLLRVHKFCIDNNLRYYLCGGTLLGAIRHKGFIPWDDDIDIHMPRPDYEYLIKHFVPDNKIRLLSPGSEGYYYNFTKAVDPRTMLILPNAKQIDGYGVFIDIFPLDGLPSTNAEQVSHVKKLNFIREQINTFSIDKPKLRKHIIKYLRLYYYYIENQKRDVIQFQKQYLNEALKYSYDDSKYVYATGGAYFLKEIYDKSFYNEPILLEFEKHYFFAPSQWDKFLTQLYGDYMELPPVEKRKSNHIFHAMYL